MDFIKKLFLERSVTSISIHSLLTLLSFLGNLSVALSAGLDSPAFHNLIASANGVQLTILLIVLAFFKKNQ